MGFFEDWFAVLAKPKDVFASGKKDASMGAAIKTYSILGGVIGLFFGFFVAIFGAVFPFVPGFSFLATLGFLAIPVLAIGFALLQVIGSLLFASVTFLFAKLLGGTGDFKTHFFLPSLYAIPIAVLTLSLNILPFIGAFLGMFLGLYTLYLLTLAFKEAHALGTLKAVMVWFLPLVLFVVLAMIWLSSLVLALAGAPLARPA